MATVENALSLTNGSANITNLFKNQTSMVNLFNKEINNVVKSTKLFNFEFNRGFKTDGIRALNKELSGVVKSINTAVDSFKKMQAVSGTAVNAANKTTEATAKGKQGGFTEKLKGYSEKVGGTVSDLWTSAQSGMKQVDKYARQNYQLEAIAQKGETPDQLRQKVYTAAQSSRTGYDSTVASVTKLAESSRDDFKSNDEAVYFTGLMNKAFGGVSAEDAAKSIEKVTAGMVKGKFKGEDLQAIMEKSPVIAQALTKYTGQSQEKLAAGPGISDDVMKNALYNSADNINAKFKQMPVTFESVWSTINNKLGSILGPIMQKITDFLGSTDGQRLINVIINSLGILGFMLNNAYNLIARIAAFFSSNWSIIAPIIWGIVAALVVYNAKMAISWLNTMKDLAVKGMHAIASGIETIQIIAMTAAQNGLNAALAMCPITWIIIAIIALIALVYVIIAAINRFAGTSISATGVIAGYFAMMVANIYNGIAFMWNRTAAFVEFFANVFTNPVYSVKRLFVNVFTNILDFIKSVASAIDMVFGSNIAGGIDDLKNRMNGWLGEKPDNYTIIPRLEMKNLSDAYKGGYSWGEKLEKSFDLTNMMGPESLDRYTKNFKPDIPRFTPEKVNDSNNLAATAANTGAMKNSMDIAEENLVYMRDIAEREAINKFTTSEISVSMGGITNNVNSELDLDGVVSYMEKKVYETMTVAAEGVHY